MIIVNIPFMNFSEVSWKECLPNKDWLLIKNVIPKVFSNYIKLSSYIRGNYEN